MELGPLNILEMEPGMDTLVQLWVRGGFPASFLARSSAINVKVRQHFIGTYLERDVAAIGPRQTAASLERLWTMLAHSQGGILNASRFASAPGTSYQTVT